MEKKGLKSIFNSKRKKRRKEEQKKDLDESETFLACNWFLQLTFDIFLGANELRTTWTTQTTQATQVANFGWASGF